MMCSRSFLTATTVTFVLIAGCGEPPSDIQQDDSVSELLTHMPASQNAATAAVIASAPDYTQLDGASVRGSGGSIHLTVDAGGEIPRQADPFIHSVAVFGYAWADLETGRAIVAVIHPTIGRDSKQNPDGWHTHPVQLTGGTVATGGTSDFCIVSIGRSQAGIAFRADLMRTNISVRWAGLEVGALDVAASFIVQTDGGCSGTGLGVDVLDTESL